jgi:succinate dehydrogenase / fumarate reductase flavoprotein subunit
LNRQIHEKNVEMHPSTEMLDLIIADGKCKGIITRNLRTGMIESHVADAVVLATGGYSNVFYLSTNAKGCNVTSIWRAYRHGAGMANPCFTQIHPTSIPVSGEHQSKLTLMSESLRNDGRVWVPKKKGDTRRPADIPESERDYYLERRYPSFGNLSPRDIASRAAKERCDAGYGVGPMGLGVYLDFSDSIKRLGRDAIEARYGNLFDMYENISGENPYEMPMRIYPAPHYTMGGLWVDYNLMTTIPGLFAAGEANFSDHGANRLGASALMQGLADGYFVLPYTIGDYLAGIKPGSLSADAPEVKAAQERVNGRLNTFISMKGTKSVDHYHRLLGRVMWDKCGMSRSADGLKEAIVRINELREEFYRNANVSGSGAELNQELEKAGRVADFFEFAELMCIDALNRNESCGGHFREEYQTEDGEAKRDDQNYCYSAVWSQREGGGHDLTKEPLEFENVHLATRSYK